MYRILVVDDQAATAEYIRAVLKTRGMTATVCGDAKGAVQIFKAQPHDLLLTDLRMEPMSGLDLIREIRAMGSQVPVVVMTGYESPESAGESMKLGVFDYVTKPLEVRELLRTIVRALALNQALSGSVDLQLLVPAHQICGEMVALSDAMIRVVETAVRIADQNQCVLVLGEDGVGRRLFAETIHRRSRRQSMPFVCISGATQGADAGGNALASMLKDAGTVFLDEVTRVAMPVQEALAAAIPEKVAASAQEQKAAVTPRLVASSVLDIPEARQAGLINESLAARFAGGTKVAIPPLRERMDDLLPLFYRMLQRECRGQGAVLPRVEMEVFDMFEHYAWPGNVGELDDAVRFLARADKTGCLRAQSLPASIRAVADLSGDHVRRNREDEFMKGAALGRYLRDAGRKELWSRLGDATEEGKTKE
jgi:DNA-binding NtrC family response regulator